MLDAIFADTTPGQAIQLAARSLPGDEQALRILPAIGRNAPGVIPDTQPEQAVLRRLGDAG